MATELKIIGFDETRPPLVQPRPCIDLILELDQEATPEWCSMLLSVASKSVFSVKIEPDPGLFVETWVKTPGEIARAVELMKGYVASCNVAYDAELKRRMGAVNTETQEVIITPEQIALNKIVAELVFEGRSE